jgi:hypothetical protein
MKIVIDQGANKIRLGRKSFTLYSTKAGEYPLCKFLCEVCGEIQFAAVQHLSGADLPDRVRFTVFRTGDEYPYGWAVDLFRCGNTFHMGVCCSYIYDRWGELVQLEEFYREFSRSLKRLRRVTVETEIDRFSGAFYVVLWTGFPVDKPLSAIYEYIVQILRSKHEQTVDSLMPQVRRAVLSGN